MELEVIVFIIIGVIIAYLAYRTFSGKSKRDLSNTVTHDVIGAPYKVEPPTIESNVVLPATEVVQEAKAPELKVEAGGKQSSKPRSRRPRNPRPKTSKTDASTVAKPATKAPSKPRAKAATTPTPK